MDLINLKERETWRLFFPTMTIYGEVCMHGIVKIWHEKGDMEAVLSH